MCKYALSIETVIGDTLPCLMLCQKCRVTIFSVSKLQIILISCAIVVTVSRLGHKYVIPVTRDKRSAQCQQNPELCQHVSFIIETSSVCYSYARVNRTEENINNEKICRPAEREREQSMAKHKKIIILQRPNPIYQCKYLV